MMNSSPSVVCARDPIASVIIPTYNYAQFISSAVESVLLSDFSRNELEVIIIDDGSTDETYERLRHFGRAITYLYQANSGKASATAAGIRHARGKYLFNLDADDLFFPEKISKVTEVFERDPSLTHVSHPALIWHMKEDRRHIECVPPEFLGVAREGRETLLSFYRNGHLFGGGSTFAVRSSVFNGEQIPDAVDMYIDEYLVLLALKKGRSFFIEEPLSIWRIHGQNYSGSEADPLRRHARSKRSLDSMRAVLLSVRSGGFDAEFERLYELKTAIAEVSAKEKNAEKGLRDILGLLLLSVKSLWRRGWRGVMTAYRYTLFQRLLPLPLLRAAKGLRKALSRI